MTLNHRFNRVLLLSMAWICLAAPVMAQPGFGDAFGAQTATAQAPGEGEDEKPPVEFSIETSAESVAPGGELVIAVILNHNDHFHTNLNEPVVPEAMGDFYPVATTLALPEVDGLSFGTVQWPEPVSVPVDFSFTGNPIQYLVYSGESIVYVPVRVDASASPGERAIEIKVRYQACDDKICLPPDQALVSTSVTISADAPAASELVGTFAGFDPSAISGKPTEPEASTSADEQSSAAPVGTFFGLELPGGGLGGLYIGPARSQWQGVVCRVCRGGRA